MTRTYLLIETKNRKHVLIQNLKSVDILPTYWFGGKDTNKISMCNIIINGSDGNKATILFDRQDIINLSNSLKSILDSEIDGNCSPITFKIRNKKE